jgi:glycosyltransferase involved in cell wall biosynthesis
MRIGVYLGYQRKEFGGGYTYLENLVEELINDNGRHDFFFFHYGERFAIGSEDRKFISLDMPVRYQGEVPALSYELLKHKIDICWFMAPPFEHVHVPIICTVWDLEHRKQPFFPEVSQTGWTWDKREANYREFLPRAAYVVAGTERGKEEIRDFYRVLNERISVIPFPTPNWVLEYKKKGDALLNDVPKPYLFYPAQFWPHKNHIALLHALKILVEKYSHDFHLVFTGSDMGNLSYVKESAERLGVGKRVIFKGFVDRHMLASLYKNAFALVYPSFFGPDNFPPLEAFAFGCPVLAASILGSHEHLGDAAMLFDPGNEDEIAEKIHMLCQDESARKMLIEKGDAFSKTRETKDCVREMIALLDDFEPYRRSWSSQKLYWHSIPESGDSARNVQYTIDELYSHCMSQRERIDSSASLPFALKTILFTISDKTGVYKIVKRVEGISSRYAHPMVRNFKSFLGGLLPNLLMPRLGVLCHHKPRPLSIPKHYTVAGAMDFYPGISIVTPSFNQADFIERTVKSVLDQNYPKLEYIIQDGGSVDGTGEILERYKGSLFHYESAIDKGQANALNVGFRHATGEIMAYLNSDDMLLPGALHYVADFFQKHPEVDVVYGHRVLIDPLDRVIGRWVLPPHDDEILSWQDYVPQETLFWRRKIWDKVGGHIDESFLFAIDWDLILRFRNAGARFARLPRFLGAFRVHRLQKTSANASAGRQEIERIRQRCHGRVISNQEVSRNIRKYLVKHFVYNLLYECKLLRY